jgi:hypothetical protein
LLELVVRCEYSAGADPTSHSIRCGRVLHTSLSVHVMNLARNSHPVQN